MSKNPEIAIIGGGPGGMTAAIILHKNGHKVRVYEADLSPDYRKQGGTLDLHADSGQIALRHAGLLDKFRAIARHDDQNSKNLDPVTGEIQEVPPNPREEMDRPEIDRGVLRKLLLDALPSDSLVWNSRLDHLETTKDGRHTLVFQNWTCVQADIVIGADGAWSHVRRALTAVVPAYTGITFLEGWIEKPTPAQSTLVGRGSMFSFGGPEAVFAQRNGEGRICVYAAVKKSREWLKDQLALRGGPSLVKWIYQNWAPNIVDLLDGCDTFIERPIYSLPADFNAPTPPGIALIGDAAHLMPPLGVGVNLAMIDAAELAIAIVQSADWREAIREADIKIGERGRSYIRETIPSFAAWFAEPSPFGRPA